MSEQVKIVECVREAWMGVTRQIPAETKAEYLRGLVGAGFRRIEAVAMLSPMISAQMSDSEDVLKRLKAPNEVEILALVVDVKGAERAAASEAVQTLVFPYSLSETHLKQMWRQSAEENSEALEAVWAKAEEKGLEAAVMVTMAFGNPYGDEWSVDETLAAVENIADLGIRTVTLGETAGEAGAERIAEVVRAVREEFDHMELGVRLRAGREQAEEKIAAAFEAGCRRFDCTLGGQAGVVPTEIVLEAMKARGAMTGFRKPVTEQVRMSEDLALRFGR